MSCWEIRNFLFGISRWHAAIYHIYTYIYMCHDAGLQDRLPHMDTVCCMWCWDPPAKATKPTWKIQQMYYIQTWNQRGDFQPATLGGRRFFPGESFRTGHPLPISMDFKGFPMFGQKPEGSQLPQTSQTLEFRNLRRWQCFIYISFLSIYSPQKLTAGPCK